MTSTILLKPLGTSQSNSCSMPFSKFSPPSSGEWSPSLLWLVYGQQLCGQCDCHCCSKAEENLSVFWFFFAHWNNCWSLYTSTSFCFAIAIPWKNKLLTYLLRGQNWLLPFVSSKTQESLWFHSWAFGVDLWNCFPWQNNKVCCLVPQTFQKQSECWSLHHNFHHIYQWVRPLRWHLQKAKNQQQDCKVDFVLVSWALESYCSLLIFGETVKSMSNAAWGLTCQYCSQTAWVNSQVGLTWWVLAQPIRNYTPI